MKRLIYVVIISAMVGLMTNGVWAQSMSGDHFDRLKNLEGNWEGVKPDGQAVEVTYEVMSDGSALVETLKPAGEPNMVTVYHRDGDKLMMTHYCSAGNQPRMVGSSEDGVIRFSFVGATNLEDKSEGHMQGLELIFVDKDNFKQVWTWSEGGEETSGTSKYQRKM